MAAVPRDAFLPAELRERAWEDVALPIGGRQTISQPRVVARMCELLAPGPDEVVLDVGTGSGYHAAVLARLAEHVWTIERDPRLAERAARALRDVGATNVTAVVGDGSLGLPDHGPFPAINVAAAARPAALARLAEQLAPGGRLVAPLVDGEERIVLLRRGEGGLERTEHERVRFVPLVEGRRRRPGR
ncbi:MAG: protein-L-isoaspartate(D-aspartate) O-methyltransferase [Actinomycetota bacterium]|nr:protein-L-isoaspartate(D-aspartate) O-methyltransferase [Actinomycetota bacterium]